MGGQAGKVSRSQRLDSRRRGPGRPPCNGLTFRLNPPPARGFSPLPEEPLRMKRKHLLAGCLGLAVVLGPARAAEPVVESVSQYHPAAAESCPAADAARSREAKLVEDLIDYLGETDSMEAYTLTCMVLAKMGNAALPALPAIIRNAERLRLFEDSLNPEAMGEKREVSEAVGKCIKLILAKKRAGGATPPSGQYVKHYPQYFPPSPDFPLERELEHLEDASKDTTPAPCPEKGSQSPGALKPVPDCSSEATPPGEARSR